MVLTGTNTYGGATTINEGILEVSGVQPPGPVFLDGGTLAGDSKVGPITSLSGGGTISPGPINIIPGIATLGCADLSLNDVTTCVFELYRGNFLVWDQINVTGTVNLNGSLLAISVQPSTAPLAGDSFTIINNDGADSVNGTFAGLPEGATTNIASQVRLQISYAAGDGNDVVVRVLPFPRIWTGGGANNNWTTADNWINRVAPKAGDDLIFPPGAARLVNTNDFATDTGFNSITLPGSNYFLAGNRLGLFADLSAGQSSGENIVNIPLRLITRQGLVASIDTNGRELTLASDGELPVSGVISGTGSVVKSGNGSVALSRANTYTGTTEILAGTLKIANGSALGTSTAETTVRSGALLLLNIGLTVAEPLTLFGTLKNSLSAAPGFWTGPITLQGAAAVIEVEASTVTISGVIGGPGSFTKQGVGPLILTANNTYSGTTVLADGSLFINGAQPQNVLVLNGGTLGGTGVVGQVIASGVGVKTVSPGSSSGILTTSNVLFNSFSRFAVDLNGTTAGVNYDQLSVRGTVTLGNSQLLSTTGPGLASGQVLRIIQNDGTDAIPGTFSGLPEGSVLIASNGLNLHITYHGGDGNDVELRVTNPPPEFTSFGLQPSGYFRIQGRGFPNLLYALEASSTLLPGSWVTVAADLVSSQGLFEFIDVDAPNYPVRFYRVQSP